MHDVAEKLDCGALIVPRAQDLEEVVRRVAEFVQLPEEIMEQVDRVEISVQPIPAYGVKVTIFPK